MAKKKRVLMTEPLQRFTCEMTKELKDVLTQVAKEREESRNAALENLLWQLPTIRKAASALKIKRPERRGCGRPQYKDVRERKRQAEAKAKKKAAAKENK